MLSFGFDSSPILFRVAMRTRNEKHYELKSFNDVLLLYQQ